MSQSMFYSFKFLCKILYLAGLVDFKIGDEAVLRKIKKCYLGIILDTCVTTSCLILGLSIRLSNGEFATEVLHLFLVLCTVKIIILNIKRLTPQEGAITFWRNIQSFSTDPYYIDMRINFTHLRRFTILLMVCFFSNRIIVLLMYTQYFDSWKFHEKVLFLLIPVQDISSILIRIEYCTYIMILKKYFEKLNKLYRISVENGDKFYIREYEKRYMALCDLASTVLKPFALPILVILLDSSCVLTIQLEGVVSKLYRSENTTNWFYETKFTVLWAIDHISTFTCIIICSYLCHRNVSTCLR